MDYDKLVQYINKSWSFISGDIRTCKNCNVAKTVHAFKGKDNTCKLCRKLLNFGLRYSYQIKLSPIIMLDNINEEALCASCEQLLPIHTFAKFSYECMNCWSTHNTIELAKYEETCKNLKCADCGQIKPMTDYQLGRLICHTCVCRSCKADKQQKED